VRLMGIGFVSWAVLLGLNVQAASAQGPSLFDPAIDCAGPRSFVPNDRGAICR